MIKPAVVMALKEESAGMFEKEGIKVHYSGVGKLNAAYLAMKLIEDGAKCILNLGTAGSEVFPIYRMVQIQKITDRDLFLAPLGLEDPKPIYAQTISLGFPWAWCTSGDTFKLDKVNADQIVVDMEAYAIAHVCKQEGTQFHSYKYITDASSEHAAKDWRKNLEFAPLSLLRCYKQFMEVFCE